MDINEIVVSNKLPFRKREYFIGYKDEKNYTFMHILSKNEYIQRFQQK